MNEYFLSIIRFCFFFVFRALDKKCFFFFFILVKCKVLIHYWGNTKKNYSHNKESKLSLQGAHELSIYMYVPKFNLTSYEKTAGQALNVRINFGSRSDAWNPYGCETWSVTLREESSLRLFEKRVLRRIRIDFSKYQLGAQFF